MLAVTLLAVVGCGSNKQSTRSSTSSAVSASAPPGAGKPAFTLGTKNFTEEFILGQLYAQALRAKGYTVTVKNDLGPSEVMDRRLSSGSIQGYPEYTGTILTVIARNFGRPASAERAYRLAAAVEARRGNELLAMAPAADTDVIVARPAYAKSHRLRSLANLIRLDADATLAGPPEFRNRFNGLVGLKDAYGVRSLRFLPMPIGRQYQAVVHGRAELAVGFTTDGILTRGGFRLLKDPKNIFGFQNVTFVVRRGVIRREGSAFAQTIDAVSAHLTTPALRLMNAAVTLDGQTPAAVARQFLGANRLL